MDSTREVITEAKIRASYGTLGNQNIGSNYPTAQMLTISSIAAAGKIYPIVAQQSLANKDITWETTYMADVGIDLTLWEKFTVTADYYYKKTDGILMQLDIPSTIGLNSPYQNAGVVVNNGWEVALGYNNRWGDWSFGVQANLSDVINEIVDMKGTYGTSGVIRNQEGSSINSLYLLNCLGIVQTQEQADWVNANCPQYGQITHPGDLIYEDHNKDNKIDDSDKQIMGSLIPRYTYGLTLNVGWKGINLSAQFQGVGMADAYISGAYTQPCVSGGTFQKSHLDNWTPENRDAKYPRLSYQADLNKKVSTFWMANGAYCRLKNLQLSYTFPKKIVKAMKIKGLMVYANATNLFTISNYYDGYDPETAYQSGSQGATTGSIGNNYPLCSTYTFGAEIKF
jgi:TonB-linked SusC/RagA family outer membrane protein